MISLTDLPNLSASTVWIKLASISVTLAAKTRRNSSMPVEAKISTRNVVNTLKPLVWVKLYTVRITAIFWKFSLFMFFKESTRLTGSLSFFSFDSFCILSTSDANSPSSQFLSFLRASVIFDSSSMIAFSYGEGVRKRSRRKEKKWKMVNMREEYSQLQQCSTIQKIFI